MLLNLPKAHGAVEVQEAMIEAMASLPETLRRTLTWDQGMEMRNHVRIATATDLEIYFCDPHAPWQRGTNENTNGVLRQYCGQGHLSKRAPVLLLCYRMVMAVRKKRSISMPPDLDAEIATAAHEAGLSYSAWLAETARKEFTLRAGLAAVSQFEQEHGPFSPEEIAEADAWAARAIARTGQGTAGAPRRSA